MVVGACSLQLHLPACTSLKAKRGRLKPLLARLHREFNVAAAEVDLHDVWHSAAIGIVVVSNDAGQAQAHLENVVKWVEHNRPEVQVVDAQIELR
jgi:uncharacterized protein YlxP (DUF503 family)